jgi:hypothetical protein
VKLTSAAGRSSLALVWALGAVAGCGGSDRIDRAQYAREADERCAATQTRAAAGGQPLSLDALGRRLATSHAALRDGAGSLHDLRDRLDDPVPGAISTFDRSIDPVVSVTKMLLDDAQLGDVVAVRKHAERLRRRASSLYDAARAAGLEECGRGGNRAADRALFVAYRTQYLVHRDYLELNNRLVERELRGREGRAAFVRAFDGLLQRLEYFRDDLAQLAAPRELAEAHLALERRTADVLRSGRRVRAAIARDGAQSGDLPATADRFDADFARLGAADGRLRRLLSGTSPTDASTRSS